MQSDQLHTIVKWNSLCKITLERIRIGELLLFEVFLPMQIGFAWILWKLFSDSMCKIWVKLCYNLSKAEFLWDIPFLTRNFCQFYLRSLKSEKMITDKLGLSSFEGGKKTWIINPIYKDFFHVVRIIFFLKKTVTLMYILCDGNRREPIFLTSRPYQCTIWYAFDSI